jgi:hypothetical protein
MRQKHGVRRTRSAGMMEGLRGRKKVRRAKRVWIPGGLRLRILLWLRDLPDGGGYEDVNHPSDPVGEGSVRVAPAKNGERETNMRP